MVFDTKSSIHQDLLKKYNKISITKREYASEIGVSISTIDSYIAKDEGVPRYIKLGSSKNAKVLFNIVDVAEFLANGIQGGGDDYGRQQTSVSAACAIQGGGGDMDYKNIREQTRQRLGSKEASQDFLQNNIGINVTRAGYIRVRTDDKTPSCIINKDGSFHDFGSGQHYSDMVSLLYDGYQAFDSLLETMEWLCSELDINMETHYE